MTRTLPSIAAMATIFIIIVGTYWLASPWSTTDVASSILLSALAVLVALRVWQKADFEAKSAVWWLSVAVASTVLGLGLWLLDVRLGYLVLPIPQPGTMWDAIMNPYAVMVSAAFFPLFTAVSTATALRVVLRRKLARTGA
jgi:hypothetical protein